MSTEHDAHNIAIVLEAFDTLFNQRDFAAAERYWSSSYVQHSAAVPPGRDGLFGHIAAFPATVGYEHHAIAANRDFVLVHGRFSGPGLPKAIISANVIRMESDMLAEHWEVLQEEATRAESKSGLPMFGTEFPA